MSSDNMFQLSRSCPVKAQNAGLLISLGNVAHPTRVIHSHELIFVKRGVLQMWEENQVFSLTEGQSLHLWPMRRHGSVGEMPPDLEFYWIHFEIEPGFQPNKFHEMVFEVPQVKWIGRPEKLESLFRYFLDEQESGYLQQAEANLLTMLMLSEVARPSTVEQENSDTISVLANQANTYIRTNYGRPITPGEVAEALGYNPDYLGRVYRKVFGCTLTEAIHRRRIRVACRYLLDTNMTIDEIGQSCGFSDSDYFRRIFRRYMQNAPSTYRKLFARIHVNTH